MGKEQNINKIFKILKKENPSPTTELYYKDVFTLLVAVVLSAQSTDKGVNKVTEKLFKKADTPEKMYKLGISKIKNLIKNIGLFNSKAKNVFLLSKKLIEEFNSVVPDNRDELIKLPGVGRKTANVILNTYFNKPFIAVDTHLFRLGNRIGLAKGKNVLEVENNYLKIIPNWAMKDAHHWLILHGRYVCKARNPECNVCKIKEFCEFFKKEIYYG
jgi:endonuclease-3|tara:strand:- start:376 stop:1020 length:645 start_codon:yes stop_codon:yes gene_type:complete